MVEKGVYWCPTIYVGVYVAEGAPRPGRGLEGRWSTSSAKAFGLAVKKGVKIAYGTDAGGYAWTENQAKEFAYMVKYGMTPMQAIQSATIVAAELLQAENDIGLRSSRASSPTSSPSAATRSPTSRELERVKFVMKGGQVYKGEMST